MVEREIEKWVTIKGVHVPIYKGETTQDAYNRQVAKNNEDLKAKQIEQSTKNIKDINDSKGTTRKEEDIPSNILVFGTAIITDKFVDIDGYSNKPTLKGALSDLAKALGKYDKGEADALRASVKAGEAEQYNNPSDSNNGVQYILEYQPVDSAGRFNDEDEYKTEPAKWYVHTRIVK